MDQLTSANSPISVKNRQFAEIKEKIIKGDYKIILTAGKSKIWDIFGKVDIGGSFLDKVVACKDCSSVLTFTKSTSNLVKHKCYKTFIDRVDNRPRIDVDDETRKDVVRSVTGWVVKNCRSFQIVEDEGLWEYTELILSIGAKYGPNVDVEKLLPHPTTVSRNIDKLYKIAYEEIRTELKELSGGFLGLTSDLWTDTVSKHSYLSLTVHFITNAKLVTKLLAFKSMDSEPCTNERILQKVREALDEFDCSLDKAIIVTDRGTNMKAAFQHHKHIFCINHLLHNIVEKSLNESADIKEMKEKCSHVVRYFKKSGANAKLTTTLKSISPTRWNTVYYMLQSLKNNWVNVGNILEENRQLHRISGISLNTLTDTLKVLAKFEETSKELEGDSYPTLHLVIVHVYYLMRHCESTNDELECVQDLKLRLRTLLKDTVLSNLTMIHKIALFLFPPTNNLSQFTAVEKNEVKEHCRTLLERLINEASVINNENCPQNSLSNEKECLFSGFLQSQNIPSSINRVQQELILYENISEVMHNDFDVLKWWEFNKLKYPLLFQLSRIIFATPASSASSERVFSSAKQLLSDKRSSLGFNPTSVEKIMFLHINMKNN